MDIPEIPQSAPPSIPQQAGDATGGIIPYKNPQALASYYLGVFSIIPLLGFLLGVAAIPLGISGLRMRRKTPAIRGAAHAWVGIVVGGLSVLVHLILLGFIFYGIFESRRVR